MDNEIDVTAILFLLVQNSQQTHDWTLIGSGANGLGIQEWQQYLRKKAKKLCLMGQIDLESHRFPEYWQDC